jgi:hypothetical protein
VKNKRSVKKILKFDHTQKILFTFCEILVEITQNPSLKSDSRVVNERAFSKGGGFESRSLHFYQRVFFKFFAWPLSPNTFTSPTIEPRSGDSRWLKLN